MRGIPRQAVHENLPVKGTTLHAQDVADTEHTCAWNHDNYGLKRGDAGAQAWYDAQVDLLASWGLDFLKVDDMQTPFFPEEIEAYHHAIERAEAAYGRPITLSLSPGGWVASTHVDFLRGVSQMWRISDDLWDRWEDIYQQFPGSRDGRRCSAPAIGPTPTCCRSDISACAPNAAMTANRN